MLHPDVIPADAGIQAAVDLYFCFRKSDMMSQKMVNIFNKVKEILFS